MSSLSSLIPLQRSTSAGNTIKTPVANTKVAGLSVGKKVSGLSVVKLNTVQSLSPLETLSGLADFLVNDDAARQRSIEDLLSTVSLESPAEKRRLAAHDLAAIISKCGLTSNEGSLVVDYILAEIAQTGTVSTNAGGLLILQTIMARRSLVRIVEPFLIPNLFKLFKLASDKSQAVREGSSNVVQMLMRNCNPFCFRLVLPDIARGMATDDWKIKVAALTALRDLSPRVSKQLTPFLATIIPICSECVIDTKPQVQSIAVEALTQACSVITNDDIRHLVPQLVSVIARPEECVQTIDMLMETTFVQNVDSATLALIAPTLGKVMRGRSSALKRKAARVIDSMCRLVQEPQCVAPFVPMLLPYLDRAIDEVNDPEVVDVCTKARSVLLQAMGEGGVKQGGGSDMSSSGLKRAGSSDQLKGEDVIGKAIAGDGPPSPIGLDPIETKMCLLSALQECIPAVESQTQSQIIVSHVASLLAQLVVFHTPPNPNTKAEDSKWRSAVAMAPHTEWKECIAPYVSTFFVEKSSAILGLVSDEHKVADDSKAHDTDEVGFSAAACESAEQLSYAVRVAALGGVADVQNNDDEDGANLCNIEFSLAYGGKVLLQNSKLRLGKGRRYGLMGKNGAGKTTLLTNIGNGAIEGLPSTLKTVYVQHDDSQDDHGVPMIDEMLAGEDMIKAQITKEDAMSALYNIKFTEQMLLSPRSCLSGGWKMKLLIVKAMLARADVLLLDEPTNHLDKASVQWLIDYISNAHNLTCLIVSHDTIFLDNVITDVIHYESQKLVYYHGNLTEFVKIHPEAKYYYDLETSTLNFKFPIPEKLDGINSSTKSVMFAKGVTFTYPGASIPQLSDVNVKVCLSSRIAVIGANGAGKSTLIKMLVKETAPDCGEIWSHMNLRVAYVAQHSFHHVEQHVEKSPVDYMKWRFSNGVDKESLMKGTVALDTEEIVNRVENQKYGDVTEVVSRRKNGKNIEYEVKFFGQSIRDPNKYFTLEQMIDLGHRKLVEQMDIKVAAMSAGLDVRPLLNAEIQSHLDDFCLEAEYGTHGLIRRLSGGQKVKLVLAAAMWNRPHVLVLDEPTNYLDREALGALTRAIKDFGGGVLIISHNSEFTNALCSEEWLVEKGKVIVEGEAEETAVKAFDKNNKIRKSKSASSLIKEDSANTGVGCTNSTVGITELIMNPKRLEPLTAKEEKKLSRLAAVAGKSLKDYILGITKTSPEWKWL
jgi:elongation factor 3